MKRIVIASILALALLLCGACLFACSPEEEIPGIEYVATVTGKTPEQLYSEVQASVNALAQGGVKQVVTQKISVAGMTFHQEMVCITDGVNMKGSLETNAEPSMNFTFVLVDGMAYYYYPNNSLGKIKGELDVAKTEEQLGIENSGLMNVPEEWFEGMQFIKVNDNSYCLSFVIGSEYFASVFDALLGAMNIPLGALEDLKYEVYFDGNGEFVCMDTVFSYTVQGYTYNVNQRATLEEYDGTPITAPADASSYQDYDFSQLFG